MKRKSANANYYFSNIDCKIKPYVKKDGNTRGGC